MGAPVWPVIELLAIGLVATLAGVAWILWAAWAEQRNPGAPIAKAGAMTMEGYYRILVGLYDTLEHAQQQQDTAQVAQLVEAIRELRQRSPFANSEQAEP